MTGAAITGKIHRLCHQIGVETWPKMFVNLRASCERDLFKAGHAIDEIAAWLGHSPEMALRHYSRVVKEQKARAAGRALRAAKTVNGAELADPATAPESVTYDVLDVAGDAMTITIDVSPDGTAWWTYRLVRD